MEASSPLFFPWRRSFEKGLLPCHLSVPSVGPGHITQICAVHLQSLTSASTVAAKVTLQESAPADQMITERNQGQHQGTSRTAEQATQVVKHHNFNINKDSSSPNKV